MADWCVLQLNNWSLLQVRVLSRLLRLFVEILLNKLNTKLSNLQKSNYRHNTSKDANNLYSKLQSVSYYKKTGKYVAQIRIKGKLKYLGTFDTDIEASEKYNNYLKNYNNGTV